MKELMDNCKDKSNQIITFSQDSLDKLFNPPFYKLYDCIIFSNSSINYESEEEFNDIINRMYGDKTGFESSNTETLINSFIKDDELTVSDILPVALTVINNWINVLKRLEPNCKFCFILSCDCEMSYVTLRFHKVRNNEQFWISDDIENFQQPVGYVII